MSHAWNCGTNSILHNFPLIQAASVLSIWMLGGDSQSRNKGDLIGQHHSGGRRTSHKAEPTNWAILSIRRNELDRTQMGSENKMVNDALQPTHSIYWSHFRMVLIEKVHKLFICDLGPLFCFVYPIFTIHINVTKQFLVNTKAALNKYLNGRTHHTSIITWDDRVGFLSRVAIWRVFFQNFPFVDQIRRLKALCLIRCKIYFSSTMTSVGFAIGGII